MGLSKGLHRLYLDLDRNRSDEYRSFMRGVMKLIPIRPGLSCRIDNAEVTAPFREVSRMGSPQLLLQFRLKSPSLVQYPAENRSARLAPHFAVILMPRGERKSEVFESGQQDTVVTLHCTGGFLQSVLAEDVNSLPSWFERFLAGEPVNMHLTRPLSPVMREVAVAIVGNDVGNNKATAIHRLFLEAKCLELLGLAFQSLLDEQGREQEPVNLSGHDSAQIAEVKAQLDDSFPQMPSLAALTAELGLSDWKLNQGFKAMYGQTPSDYFLSLRMEKAKALLRDTQLPVSAIALEVGYEFATNFSKAFKQSVGVSPRDYRGGRLLPGTVSRR